MIGVEPRIHVGGGGGVMLYIHTQKMLPFRSLFFIFLRKKKSYPYEKVSYNKYFKKKLKKKKKKT